jgi:hypothetical protein
MFKNFLKDKLLIAKIRNRFIPSVQIAQRQLFHQYQLQARQNNLPPIEAPSAMGQPLQRSVAHGPKGFRHVLSFFQKVD